jgi:hypothetical protein
MRKLALHFGGEAASTGIRRSADHQQFTPVTAAFTCACRRQPVMTTPLVRLAARKPAGVRANPVNPIKRLTHLQESG